MGLCKSESPLSKSTISEFEKWATLKIQQESFRKQRTPIFPLQLNRKS
jgi:hypothetical protein